MTTFLVAGYQNSDLGIFSNKDPRLAIIRKGIRRHLIRLLEESVEWFVFTGNLGFEYWVLEELRKLQNEGYDCQLASVFCFETHGQHWNEDNQEKLSQFKQVDFVKSCYEHYENPGQLKEFQEFLLANTQGCLIFYDEENPTKLSYLYDRIKSHDDYEIACLTFNELNELATDID